MLAWQRIATASPGNVPLAGRPRCTSSCHDLSDTGSHHPCGCTAGTNILADLHLAIPRIDRVPHTRDTDRHTRRHACRPSSEAPCRSQSVQAGSSIQTPRSNSMVAVGDHLDHFRRIRMPHKSTFPQMSSYVVFEYEKRNTCSGTQSYDIWGTPSVTAW